MGTRNYLEHNAANSDWERDKFEYQMAQEMLRHYDSLNWQIGAILIAGTLVLTALVFKGDALALLNQSFWPTVSVLLVAPFISFLVLSCWALWFRRHRSLYNLRNEVCHRIEFRYHMFHYLRVVKADLSKPRHRFRSRGPELEQAAKQAGYKLAGGNEGFQPIYEHDGNGLPRPSGHKLVWCLALGIPIIQSVGIIALILCHHYKLR